MSSPHKTGYLGSSPRGPTNIRCVMLTLSTKLPRQLYVAVSGGVDSVAALDFLARNHDVRIAHLNHNEGNSNESAELVHKLASYYNCPIYYKHIKTEKPRDMSREEFWRNQRYTFFHSINSAVVTAHTLDDCVETWLWSSLHGRSKLIPYANRNVIRPFLQTRKQQFVNWAIRHKLLWVEDESNSDLTLARNYIRHKLMPEALQVNPGLHTTILKVLKEQNVK